MSRTKPNIIITGTPGVGKTSLCELLTASTELQHIAINRIAKERDCHDGWDKSLKSWIVDEDKVLDAIEDEIKEGGFLVDWHACDLFPESWIDLVIVLRSNSSNLYDRLRARNYSDQKLQENMDAEIMGVLLDEARNAFNPGMIIELQSNHSDDMESNALRIRTWIGQWKQEQGSEAPTDGLEA
ncbi:MAG: hypothetical protein Q9182_007495 [Xanthomendoza sp. 2 TL-2023]